MSCSADGVFWSFCLWPMLEVIVMNGSDGFCVFEEGTKCL